MDIQDQRKTGHTDEEEDKDKTPSPHIAKRVIKESGNSAGGATEERSNRSEDDLFLDAVTEFSDNGISPGATKLLESPIVVKKVDDDLEVFETPDIDTKVAVENEEHDVKTVHNATDTQIKLLDSDTKHSGPLVEDRDGSCKDKLIDLMDRSNSVEMKPDSANADSFEVSDKDQEEQAVYVLSVPSDIPLVDHSETLIDDFKDHQTKDSNVPMVLDYDTFEVKTTEDKIQESQTLENGESAVSEHTNTRFSALVPTDVIEEDEVAETKPLEMNQTVPESTDDLIEAKVSLDVNQEKLEFDHEYAPEVVKETETDHSDPVLTEKDPALERLSEAYAREIVKEPGSGFEAEQKIVGNVGVDSKEGDNLGISQSSEKLMAEKAEQRPTASGIVSGSLVDEGDGKLMTNQDSVVDVSVGSSSRNSLEGNWGSVSVLSTASIDAENAHMIGKLEIMADRRHLGKSDGFEGRSALVKPEEEIVEPKTCDEPPKSEANESEGRKRNEEAIAKVTNWTTSGDDSNTPLKNVAKLSNPKQLPTTTIEKDEKSREAEKLSLVLETPPSPPTYIGEGEGKKVKKKGKGRGLWAPFVCCSSVNVN